MTKEEILNAAWDAALATGQCSHDLEWDALIAIVEVVIAAEREACAKLADSMNTFGLPPDVGSAIRARP